MRDADLNAIYSTLSDVDALLGNAVESHTLEFKRGDLLDKLDESKVKNEFIKDVSAFANAGGGTIIYGIEEGENSIAKSKKPVTNEKATASTLVQILRTGLEPVFSKYHVESIDVPGEGRIIVITVGQANTAHQCRHDHKYYHRVGSISTPMHDYEIRDVMNRRTAPVIRVEHTKRNNILSSDHHEYLFVPTLVNDGRLTAKLWMLEVILPSAAGHLGERPTYLVEPLIHQKINLESLADYTIFEFSSERTAPKRSTILLPGQSITLDKDRGYESILLTVKQDTYASLSSTKPSIWLRLYVDDCRMEQTEIQFQDWCKF